MVTNFNRIVVTGNSGSGKTTLSRKLAEQTDIPLYHLDSIIYEKNWKKRSRTLIKKSISEITDKDAWIIDGVSKIAYEKADAIVFLDFPPIVSFFRAMIRMFFSSRKEVPEGCREIDAFWLVLKLTFLFPKQTRPLILSFKKRGDCRFYQLSSDNEVEQFLEHTELAKNSINSISIK